MRSLLALWAVLPATISFEFVNPASHGSQSSFSQGSVYTEHSVLQIRWTSPYSDQDATVGLFQVNTSSTLASSTSPQTIGDIEYLAEGQAYDRTSRQWIVVTNKDLSVSNVFVMMLFVTEATSASDMTVYFNITSPDSDSASTDDSSTSTSASSASSSATTRAQLSPTLTVSNPSASTTASDAASQSSSDMNSSAKIGLGVGIPAAAIVGVLATWLVFRRRRAPTAKGCEEQPQEDKVVPMVVDEATGATSRPASKAMSYGPASSTHGSVPLPSTHTGPTVYEASNEPANVSELYAPTYYRS
ncbi:hypothetical protein J7T55_001476 [Diaporthe amygdali]|uniref:uncharacterized protein n=1 Tax=Phomopsis amygdali TaxID=1214568 RepID=UPI0022FDBCD3|nr:uncharacterized protein J7T55_001476 [Diaporthe amygdali]KAJ0115067.1 hypothetical protein J7T55_001476 [Diaporthe amygdali]